MKKLLIFLLTFTVLLANAGVKLHTIGDSTMDGTYDPATTYKRGWCMMLQQFFNSDNITINNRGKSGASSKSFYQESAYWPTLVKGGSDEMQSGDYLIIQFAHNDEKDGGADGDVVLSYYNNGHQSEFTAAPDYRGTTPSGTFKEYLRKYINEAKAMGVKPILVGAICRKYFKDDNGTKINANGQHNLYASFTKCDGTTYSTGNKLTTDDHSMDYTYQMSEVAKEYDDVPFINLTQGTKELYESYGDAYCTANLFGPDDSTHPAALGATLISRTFAQMLKSNYEAETSEARKAVLKELYDNLVLSNDISFNPVSGDMGEAYVGMSSTKEFNISAFGLASETGTFTISASEGFLVSTDKTNWTSSVEASYTGSTLITSVYVKASISKAGIMTGTLTASDGTNSKTLDLTVKGIDLSGGTETSCVWPLNSTAVTPTSELLTGADVTTTGMKAHTSTGTPTSPEGHGAMLLFTTTDGTWPAGEIDENSTRYIEFKATVPDGKTFNMDKISFDVVGWGGNSVCYHAYYATKSDFSDQVQISAQDVAMTNKTANSVSADVVKKIEEGESIYIRIYPWLKVSSAATGKYIGLSDVTIHGMLSNAGGDTGFRYALSVTVSPAGAGTVTKDPQMDTYKEGKQVTLTATKNFGYKFTGWQDATGAVLSTENPYTVTMDAEKNITAAFEAVPTYTIKTNCVNDSEMSGMGSVTLTPNTNNGKYEAGDEITVTASTSDIAKFMHWEDGTTANPRSYTVNADATLTATYEIQDFIAVFDASKTAAYDYSGNGFAADVTWDENRNANAKIVKVSDGTAVYTQTGGTPVVRNREGAVLSGINGLYQNGYRTSDIAWQYQFSTKGFTSAKFKGDMAAKNMAHKNYKAQYSLDGTTFTDVEGATWAMTANTKQAISFDLPAACIGQDMVYIRITGTGTEQLSSSYEVAGQFLGLDYYAHSETGIGNLYILGEAETVVDPEPPTVASTVPVNGAAGVSAGGTITVSYNKKIQAGSVVGATATLDGKEVTPTWNTRSVSFSYAGLAYGSQHTLIIPAGYVESKSGVATTDAYTLTFTVMDRQKPQARIFDAVVDKTLTLEHGKFIAATETMPKQYRYIQDAIDDAPAASTKPYLIYIKEGYYDDPNMTVGHSTTGGFYGYVYKDQTAGSTDTETIQIYGDGTSEDGLTRYDDCRIVVVNKPNIHLIGEAADKVTIATDRQDGGDLSHRDKPWYHVNCGAALEIQSGATDFTMQGITLDNENWTKDKKAGPQALCINANADRVTFDGLNIRSYQDDFYSHGQTNRYYWNDVRIEGAVDFIYGEGNVWFENTTIDINRDKGGYIVAPSHQKAYDPWGYIFNNTKITSTFYDVDKTQVYLGRPWHDEPVTVFLHTKMEIQPYTGYWYDHMGGLPSLWAVYDIVDKNGTKMSEESIKDYWYMDGDTKVTGTSKNYLTDDEVAQYTVANVMKGDGTNASTGVWNPLNVVEKPAVPVASVNGNIATWTTDEYAICYVVTVNGTPAAFVTEGQYVGNKGDVITVQSVNENGLLSTPSNAVTVGSASDVKAVENQLRSHPHVDGYYTVDGKKVGYTAKKGIYINNGKTVLR